MMNIFTEEGSKMKKCARCEKFLPKDLFYRNKQSKDKLSCYCRRCESSIKKDYRDTHPESEERRRAKQREWYGNNKTHKQGKNKEWIQNNPSKYREINLKSRFGISTEIYNNMLEEQGNCCKICGIHKDEVDYFLVVDHCHKTGKLRGILYRKCNLGIGHLNDDIELLNKAIVYLKNNKEVTI